MGNDELLYAIQTQIASFVFSFAKHFPRDRNATNITEGVLESRKNWYSALNDKMFVIETHGEAQIRTYDREHPDSRVGTYVSNMSSGERIRRVNVLRNLTKAFITNIACEILNERHLNSNFTSSLDASFRSAIEEEDNNYSRVFSVCQCLGGHRHPSSSARLKIEAISKKLPMPFEEIQRMLNVLLAKGIEIYSLSAEEVISFIVEEAHQPDDYLNLGVHNKIRTLLSRERGELFPLQFVCNWDIKEQECEHSKCGWYCKVVRD